MSADRKELVDARAAIAEQGEEYSDQGGEDNGPTDGAGPYAEHWDKALVKGILSG
jgi:hypothetical protein